MSNGQSAATPWWQNKWVWVVAAVAVIAFVVVLRFAVPTAEAGPDAAADTAESAAAPADDGTALVGETKQAVLDAHDVDGFSEIEASDYTTALMSYIASWDSFSEGRVTIVLTEKVRPADLEAFAQAVLGHAEAVADLDTVVAVDAEGLAESAERVEGP